MNNLTHMLNKYLFPIFSDTYTTALCKKFTNIQCYAVIFVVVVVVVSLFKGSHYP